MSEDIVPEEFVEVPVTKSNLAKRRLVQGVGLNDAKYYIERNDSEGMKTRCPYYLRWSWLLKRCYSKNYHDSHPTYKGCYVSDEWLVFSNFKEWMQKQDWQGKELDKDIIIAGNKEYSSKKCVFVDSSINKLLTSCSRSRGSYPQGVCFTVGKYVACIKIYGKSKNLGRYETVEEASKIYKKAKASHIFDIAMKQTDDRVRNGLMRHAINYGWSF